MTPRDHGGGVDGAVSRYGGTRGDWLDLSTGINPAAYPLPAIAPDAWTTLPDRDAQDALITAARGFWDVPTGAAILAVPGLSTVIARIAGLTSAGRVAIPGPTYNEYAPAFARAGWDVDLATPTPNHDAAVIVHPNNPTGAWRDLPPALPLCVIDESFCDIAPDRSHMQAALRPGTLILKGIGKFWGLAGLRLGFAIGDPVLISRLEAMLGPWAVSGPALAIGRAALTDPDWADATRRSLSDAADRLDMIMAAAEAKLTGGTTLFRLYQVPDSAALQDQLARHHIWTRVFPWSDTQIRLGIPGPDGWARLTRAIGG